MANSLDRTSVTALKGVGPRVAEKLARLRIASVAELLLHLPLRYQDKTRVVPIATLEPSREALVEGAVRSVEIVSGKRRSLVCRLADPSGSITLRFFHFQGAFAARFRRGQCLRCFGEPRSAYGGLEMIHPEIQVLEGDAADTPESTLTPVYPTTEGLSQSTLRALVARALHRLSEEDDDLGGFPASLRERFGLTDFREALNILHQPPAGARAPSPQAMLESSRRGLAFEELLAHHLALCRQRDDVRSRSAFPVENHDRLQARFLNALSYEPTSAQRRVIAEVRGDLRSTVPMLRLLQGDVGSGKTLVAATAIIDVAGSGLQAAVMAPTELLCEQHFRNFRTWLSPLGIDVVALTGSLAVEERRTALASIRDGRVAVIVGTHALFQAEVEFGGLGLLVIDEQHRFGVHQRLALRQKSGRNDRVAHQLVMTATPIPRTLAMTAYASLDQSVIDELPPGRSPVETVVVGEHRREEVIERVAAACCSGRQAYWVCTLIEDSEALQCQAAEATSTMLRQRLPELRVGLIHGRLSRDHKEAVMGEFTSGDIDLLVATTVIEVGVDVPNATLMIIDNAERLGLAQLHQLRGRVGRGGGRSFCVLMYHGPLSPKAHARLEVLRDSADGFEISRRDLEIRGPGEVLGTRQTGMLEFRVADLASHFDMLDDVHEAAALLRDRYPARIQALVDRWLGGNRDYGDV